ncbi:hypothetical protein D9758_011590 [Tetrapyrgos nigripes]|uniref:Uncharacterized protein n=1 Tax=Tetrapyrgos nigripes TaxID=182062 RepID=A0A8H5FQF2_9AGAR|nr:hypothetical protein D9758_011590 [Tetrapyrgos nigripes]
MAVEIIDIHVHSDADNALSMRNEVLKSLSRPIGEKTLSTMLLYDERGLRLYDDITTKTQEYYLFGAEEEILKNKADEIVRVMHHETGVVDGEITLELGAGSLRKTSHVLLGLSHLVQKPSVHRPPITYFALDLEQRELERTLNEINMSDVGKHLEGKVATKGMWGTYDDGLKYVENTGLHVASERLSRGPTGQFGNRDSSPESNNSDSSRSRSQDTTSSLPSTPDDVQHPLHILFLGSSLGNFGREDGADFLRALPLRPGSTDTLLLGLDHDNEKELVEKAYNDASGYTKEFIMNGLKAAGRVLGDESLFNEDKWEYVNKYDPEKRRHEAFYKSKTAQTVQAPSSADKFEFLEGELVKFSDLDAYRLFSESNLRPIQRWTDSTQKYSLWLLERPAFTFPLLSSARACNTSGELVLQKKFSTSLFGVPSPQEWENLWALWDLITLRMIPPSMLYQKPIDLRHICLFYLGHIPAFLDIHLSRLLQEPHTEPEFFKDIFERGIDPNVDDPTRCHSHSEVPQNDNDWPTLSSIQQFKARVRARLLGLYEDINGGKRTLTRKVGRVLWMTYEHEALHAETLLYMLLQRAGTGTLPPPGFSTPEWTSLSSYWDSLPAPKESTVTLGPAKVVLGHDDNEEEDDVVDDAASHEFGWDNEHPKREVEVAEFRIEWRPVTNGEFYQVYKNNKDQKFKLPASWIEKDGEIQVRTLYGPIPLKIAQHWPILTSYDNLSTYAMVKGGRLPTEPELRLFLDKFESGYEGGANVGFQNWHPVPATTGTTKAGGKGHNGGVWEWTSTLFDKYEGFVPSRLYPGYSQDFFDGAHQVVIGGSYATVPRLAERRSVRNWYQRNYPYPWVGARVAHAFAIVRSEVHMVDRAQPRENERRLALSDKLRSRPTGTWVKVAKNGEFRLKLNSQNDSALPVYGLGSPVDGAVEVSKSESVLSVEVKVEGRLRLKEIAESGAVSAKLCLETALLWTKDPSGTSCPPSLPFSLSLPTTFEFNRKRYPLPPTYEVKLSGLPGFHATIDYTICVVINKPNNTVPILSTNLFGINIGNMTLSTSFIYYPRSRPALGPAPPLRPIHDRFQPSTQWSFYDSVIHAANSSMAHINTRLYLPSSRIFCISQRIPFYLTLQSSAISLAAFLPLAPSSLAVNRRPTRVQILRQATVDVRNEVVSGTKTDMWRVDCIGEATFGVLNDGPTWVTFFAEIAVDTSVKVAGFKAGGLSVKDCVLFSMTPIDPNKAPFKELRQVIPIRLTTDEWIADGSGSSNIPSDSQYSIASSPENGSE